MDQATLTQEEILYLAVSNKLSIPALDALPLKAKARMKDLAFFHADSFERLIVTLLVIEDKKRYDWLSQEMTCSCHRLYSEITSPSIEQFLRTLQDPALLCQKAQQLSPSVLPEAHPICLLAQDYSERLKDAHPDLWA